MIRVILLLSLVFSIVGVTITNCACPKIDVVQETCSTCKNSQTTKKGSPSNSCCSHVSTHLVLKNDFQKPYESHSLISLSLIFYLVQWDLSLPSLFPSSNQKEHSIVIFHSSLDTCVLLSTFLI